MNDVGLRIGSHDEDTRGQSTVLKSTAVMQVETVSGPSMKEEKRSEVDLRDIYTSLPYLQSSIFATISEDTATQLRILCECNNEFRIIKTYTDMEALLKKKFGVETPATEDELEDLDPKTLYCDIHKINKLEYDRQFIIDTVLKTYSDLCLNGNFRALENTVKSIIELEHYRKNIMENEIKSKALRRELLKQIRQQRNHYKRVIYDTDAKIDNMKTQLEDSALIGECRSRYLDNWQRARTEQHIQTILNKENVFTESVEYYKQRTDHEQRETLQKVEEWMNKYDKDIEAIDLKIQLKKNKYNDMYKKRETMEETIAKHDQMMKDWVHFKEEREKARLYREKMTKSAITVQAWWRGLLVRRQLGPFKKKKQPPKKK